MNAIFFSRKHELQRGRYVIPFSCSDLTDIDTLVSFRDRSERDTKVLKSIRDRITLVLRKFDYELVSVNFSSMSITAVQL
jgi:hypothetical protein